MVGRVRDMLMATETEVQYVKELLPELLALAEDPSEWLKEEVKVAVKILEGMEKYDTSDIIEMIEERQKMNDKKAYELAEEVLAKHFDTVTLTITPEGETYIAENTTNKDEHLKVLALLADMANAAAKAEDIKAPEAA